MTEPRPFTARHIERSSDFVVELPMAQAFRFFEPEGERAWAPGWDPQYLHPPDGAVGPGLVFTTDHGGEHTVWTMARHEPARGEVDYVRLTPGSRIGWVRVRCRESGPSRTAVHVTYELTGLSDAGNEMLRQLDEKAFADFLATWGASIARVVSGARGT